MLRNKKNDPGRLGQPESGKWNQTGKIRDENLIRWSEEVEEMNTTVELWDRPFDALIGHNAIKEE